MTESSTQPLESDFLKMVRSALAIQQMMPGEGLSCKNKQNVG